MAYAAYPRLNYVKQNVGLANCLRKTLVLVDLVLKVCF